MKKFWLACTMIIAMGVSSCVDSDKDLYQEDPGTGTNPSSFSTVQKVQVEIDYSDSESRVPFSIYDGNPLIEGENTIALKENVQALDGAWTDEQGKFTGMCGELAGDPVATMILLGLGLDEFSMTASSIPLIKNILRSVTKAECEAFAQKALTMDTAEEITAYAKSLLAEKGLA